MEYAACIGRLVFYRYINTAIVCVLFLFFLLVSLTPYSTPETFELVGTTIEVGPRKNLGQISRVLNQITLGVEFDDSQPSYIPINDLVRKTIGRMTAWYLDGSLSRVTVQRHNPYVSLSCQRT